MQEQIIIGTHGRLKTWFTRRFLDFGGIRILVFDEADQMLDVGHADSSRPPMCSHLPPRTASAA